MRRGMAHQHRSDQSADARHYLAEISQRLQQAAEGCGTVGRSADRPVRMTSLISAHQEVRGPMQLVQAAGNDQTKMPRGALDTLRAGGYSAHARAVDRRRSQNREHAMPADYTALRRTMVERQVRTFDVTDQAVIARMYAVPREKFVPESLLTLAYSDVALDLPVAGGRKPRRLLPPLILGRML